MDHTQAIANGLTERYLLGELGEDDREAFEDHFFGCHECAEEVKAASAFVDAVRGTGAAPPFVRPRRRQPALARLSGRLATAAVVVLSLGLAGYQTLLVLPGVRRELRDADGLQAAPSYFLSVSRSEPRVLVLPSKARRFVLRLSTSFERPYRQYRCDLQDAAGRTVESALLPAPAPGEELQVMLSAASLPPGGYVILVEGRNASGEPGPAPEQARYVFTLRRGEE